MVGANYMGGKRNTVKSKLKDATGRAQKGFFGRQRLDMLSKGLRQDIKPQENLSESTTRMEIDLAHATGKKNTRDNLLQGIVGLGSIRDLSDLSESIPTSQRTSDASDQKSLRLLYERILSMPNLAGLKRQKRSPSPYGENLAYVHSLVVGSQVRSPVKAKYEEQMLGHMSNDTPSKASSSRSFHGNWSSKASRERIILANSTIEDGPSKELDVGECPVTAASSPSPVYSALQSRYLAEYIEPKISETKDDPLKKPNGSQISWYYAPTISFRNSSSSIQSLYISGHSSEESCVPRAPQTPDRYQKTNSIQYDSPFSYSLGLGDAVSTQLTSSSCSLKYYTPSASAETSVYTWPETPEKIRDNDRDNYRAKVCSSSDPDKPAAQISSSIFDYDDSWGAIDIILGLPPNKNKRKMTLEEELRLLGVSTMARTPGNTEHMNDANCDDSLIDGYFAERTSPTIVNFDYVLMEPRSLSSEDDFGPLSDKDSYLELGPQGIKEEPQSQDSVGADDPQISSGAPAGEEVKSREPRCLIGSPEALCSCLQSQDRPSFVSFSGKGLYKITQASGSSCDPQAQVQLGEQVYHGLCLFQDDSDAESS
ncbi:hypothetical protein AMATHDRAFT_50438 [Amanita thiersii Skay4041]|uniref:Uncharacterized protein n=1 Tax=Amanita thiersii Skay4041 TaxID=703135 RepID=A0A2A9NHW7_9AGAR|nr:hypothetical protein AMATHDRAFT_50438 [Amanita thiersii Skay4041]